MATWITGIVLAVLFAAGLRSVIRGFRTGKCSGCSGCSGSCPHCQSAARK